MGGGSVIGATKALMLLTANPKAGPTALAPFQPVGLEEQRPFLVAVPTTPGRAVIGAMPCLDGDRRRDQEEKPAANFEVAPHISNTRSPQTTFERAAKGRNWRDPDALGTL